MFETMLITTVLSITAIVVGNLVLLSLVFMMSRSRKRKAAAKKAPAMVAVSSATTEALAERSEDELDAPQSIIIDNDYEEEAQPVHSSPEFIDDSFVDFFEDIPVVTAASLPWREKHQRNSRMANRLDRLTAPPSEPSRPSSDNRTTRPNTPLPMPVAPAGVEPIPELEPTEIMIDRPDWATDWHA